MPAPLWHARPKASPNLLAEQPQDWTWLCPKREPHHTVGQPTLSGTLAPLTPLSPSRNKQHLGRQQTPQPWRQQEASQHCPPPPAPPSLAVQEGPRRHSRQTCRCSAPTSPCSQRGTARHGPATRVGSPSGTAAGSAGRDTAVTGKITEQRGAKKPLGQDGSQAQHRGCRLVPRCLPVQKDASLHPWEQGAQPHIP